MEQSKEIFVDFGLAIKALQKRCVDACTGSMYLISDKDHGAIFSIAAGLSLIFLTAAFEGRMPCG
jgi:hypothetical protein